MKSGRAEGLPYSLSRWTDVPHAKWPWFLQAMADGHMVAFDPRTAIPSRWSLRPEDTLSLVFWTKDPSNILEAHELLEPYRVKVHVTITGWHEAEKGAPTLEDVCHNYRRSAFHFKPENVTWRFSPVPLVPDVIARFEKIAGLLEGYTDLVYLSFLQPNDRVPEARSAEERVAIMKQLARVAQTAGMRVRLCNEDRTLLGVQGLPTNLQAGVCAPPEDFALPKTNVVVPSEGCGCALMVEPFTINESCSMGCQYCYAADVSLADHKRNTTKSLPVIR